MTPLDKERIVNLARDLAPELDRLINELLHSTDNVDIGNDGTELSTFLWENKIGILRVLQAVTEL